MRTSDVPAASEDLKEDPAYDPEPGEESRDEADGRRPIVNPVGRAPRNPPSSEGIVFQGASNRLAIVAAKSREFLAGAWLQFSSSQGRACCFKASLWSTFVQYLNMLCFFQK
jgi:hypothetical protein